MNRSDMTDPVIPPAAIEAAARAMHPCVPDGNCDYDHEVWVRSAEYVLRCTLPHLRPLVEAQELRLATEVALKLGRREAAEEIAVALEAYADHYSTDIFAEDGTSIDAISARAMRHAYPNAARIAREVATRTADARTDPSGHTDLPPTPDAGSIRFPEEGDEWCCGTCQRIAWEANPMSREEQSAGETP